MDMEPELHKALELRYDGPLPDRAAAPPDYHLEWPEQLQNRRQLFWLEVRRIGRLAARAHTNFRTTGTPEEYRQWIRHRRNLARALGIWATFRSLAGNDRGTEPPLSPPKPRN